MPRNAEELVLNELYSSTRTNLRFLLHDEVYREDRLLIYSSDFMLNKLFSSNLILCDGTFRMVPGIFTQLFTINIFYNDKLIPVVYCLLKRKNVDTYTKILRILKNTPININQNFAPATVLSDFENGILRSFADELPQSQQQGCLFHFCQCIYRKVQNLGLTAEYRRNLLFKEIIRVCMALSFLPSEEVLPVFTILEEISRNNHYIYQLLFQFFTYFRAEWLVLIPPTIWSVHERQIRTNNDLEGWHFSMTRDMPRQHPDIFTFLDWMIEEEAITRNTIAQIDAGVVVKRKNKKYLTVHRRLCHLSQDYINHTRTRSSFLRAVAYNLAELPQENPGNQVQQIDNNNDNQNNNDAFPWMQLDWIEGLDFVAPVWRPWL